MVTRYFQTEVTPDTVLQLVKELYVDIRNEQYLLLNVRGPRYVVGTRLVAIFIELCDGKRTVKEIFEIMVQHFTDLTIDHVLSMANSLNKIDFFEEGRRLPIQYLSNVTFNITKTCNLNCPFCYYDSSPTVKELRDETLSFDEWISVAREISNINPASHIYIAGGEPLIRPDAIDIIESISGYGLKTTLITNGTLFTEETILRLAKVSNLTVQVSIDSIIEEENEKTRGKGNLKKALQAIEWMKRAGIQVKVSSTLTSINRENLWKLTQHFKKNDIPSRVSTFFIGEERSKQNADALGLNPDELIDIIINNAKELGFSEIKRHSNKIQEGLPKYGCGVGYGTISINPDGSVSPCNHLTNSRFNIGNIRTTCISEIVAKGFQKFNFVDVDKMPSEGCASCHVRYICGGGCKANSFHAYSTMRTTPPDCNFLKWAHVETLWMNVLGSSYSFKMLKDSSVNVNVNTFDNTKKTPHSKLPMLDNMNGENECTGCSNVI